MSIEKTKEGDVKVSGIVDRICHMPIPAFTLLGDASGFIYMGYVESKELLLKLHLTKPGDTVTFILDSRSDMQDFENKSLSGYTLAKKSKFKDLAQDSLGL